VATPGIQRISDSNSPRDNRMVNASPDTRIQWIGGLTLATSRRPTSIAANARDSRDCQAIVEWSDQLLGNDY